MIGSKEIQPKVQNFDDIGKIKGDYVLLILDKEGNKYQTTVEALVKFFISNIKVEDKKVEEKLNRKDIVDMITSEDVVTFGKPLNLTGNKSIEKKIKKEGSIYSDGSRLRIFLNGEWKTIKVE